jgi:hypothetical protein
VRKQEKKKVTRKERINALVVRHKCTSNVEDQPNFFGSVTDPFSTGHIRLIPI